MLEMQLQAQAARQLPKQLAKPDTTAPIAGGGGERGRVVKSKAKAAYR